MHLPPTLVFHFSEFLVVLFQSFPQLLVLCFNVVQTLHFELELLPEVQSRHGICGRGKRASPPLWTQDEPLSRSHGGSGQANRGAQGVGTPPPAGSPRAATACQRPGHLWPQHPLSAPKPPAEPRAARLAGGGGSSAAYQGRVHRATPWGRSVWTRPGNGWDLPTAPAWYDTGRTSRSLI